MFFSITAHPLEDYYWLFSLVIHFREWFIGLGLVLLLILPWVTRWRLGALCVCLVSILLHSFEVVPYRNIFKESHKIEFSKKIDVFYANLNSNNQDKTKLIEYLREKQPDFVFLVEFNESWAKEVKSIESIYPYAKAIVKEDNFGMAILGKTPLIVNNVFVERENMIPALFLQSKNVLGAMQLVLLHPFPPIGSYGTLLRNRYLGTLSRKIGQLTSPLLVCGDFNTTPWTSTFNSFLKNGGLNFGKIQFVKNTWFPSPVLPGLPIDHCLVRGLEITQYNVGPDIGSDHRPLVLSISQKQEEKPF